MENDHAFNLEFLTLDNDDEYGSLSESERHVLLSISRFGDTPWKNPVEPEPLQSTVSREESVEIEFGCASEVFNSINAGNFNPSLSGSLLLDVSDPSPGSGPIQVGAGEAVQQQHIHINNYTANLSYHSSGKCQI